MSEGKKWYAVYTKPRWEKKVFERLQNEQMEAYCPQNRVRKKWSDRMKWVQEPLFKSYVFVKVAEEEMTRVRMVSGVVNFVYWLGKPAAVKQKEIETIRKFLNNYSEVQAVPLDLKADSRVTIQRGILMDKSARIIKVLNSKVQVVIESIGFTLVAVVDKSNVAVVKEL
ncbi:MAG TPA: UpxY family transcription antiterminator [Puia sp.]|jgi:transcription antitermination factor NusG|nr:UpxY family transcription antiterminator [Puia sp.]